MSEMSDIDALRVTSDLLYGTRSRLCGHPLFHCRMKPLDVMLCTCRRRIIARIAALASIRLRWLLLHEHGERERAEGGGGGDGGCKATDDDDCCAWDMEEGLVAVTVGALRHGCPQSGNCAAHTVRNRTGFQFNL